MKVRIYTNIESRVNENWNQYGKLISSPSKESFKDPLITGKPNGHQKIGAGDYQQDFYQKIGIDIVTETVFSYPYPATTEKILRPIINKRMFMVVSTPI